MTSASLAEAPPRKRTLLVASCVGTSIEWYDYYIFATAASLVFGELFFPSASPVASTLAAYGSFAVGFVVRPLGAAVVGHFGDRIGRKTMLVLTLLMAGVATFLVGVLPTFAAIGVAAPVLLVILRLLQGFAVGGEWGGATLIATENAPARERAAYGSFAQFGVPIGVLTSNLAFLAVSGLSDSAFQVWGWRIPFFISIIMLAIGIFARRRLNESPEFRRLKQQNAVSKVPVADLFRQRPGTLLLACLAAIAPPAVGYTVIVYMLNYGTRIVGFGRRTLLTLILLSTLVWIAVIYLAALVADRVGAQRIYALGAVTGVCWAFPLFALVTTGNAVAALVAFIVAAVVQAIMAGAQGRLFAEIFDTHTRYTGMSVAYQVGGMVGGAVTPIVLTALYANYQSYTPIAAYVGAMSLLSLVAVLAIGRGFRVSSILEPAGHKSTAGNE